jgi:hypothetical protein
VERALTSIGTGRVEVEEDEVEEEGKE